MSEYSIAQARASVMLYDNERKQWQPSGGSQGLSRVNVYHHPVNNTFRIVGRKVNDLSVVINCALARGLKYNEATPTFHQWRDQRQVYGLNFQSRDDAEVFGQAVREALETLKEAANPASAAAPPTYHQRDQYYQESVSNGPAGGQEDMMAHVRQRQAADYDSQDNYSRSRVVTGGAQDRHFRPQYDTQGSGGGSESESPNSSQLSVASSVGPTSPTQSAAPPAPTPPPAPPAPAAPAPPQPPPVPAIGAPAAPPPPPAPPTPSIGGGGGSLAEQIAAAKLRKSSKGDSGEGGMRPERSGSVRGNNAGVGGMDMMAEMQKKLAARRAKQDDKPSTNGPVNQEERSFPSVRSTTTTSNTPSFSSNTNKTNFAAPAKVNKSESRFNNTSSSSKGDSTITSEQLEEFKTELIMAFRQELESYKDEIVEGFDNVAGSGDGNGCQKRDFKNDIRLYIH